MRKLKIFVAVLTLLFVLGLAAPASYAGDILTPGITGTAESPGITGNMDTPGITGDQPPPSVGETQIAGEIQFPGVVYILAALFGISWSG